jgi:hypothetical protein
MWYTMSVIRYTRLRGEPMTNNEEAAAQTDSVLVAFRCPRALADAAGRAAALEGLTRSDIARRALLYALAGKSNQRASPRGAQPMWSPRPGGFQAEG